MDFKEFYATYLEGEIARNIPENKEFIFDSILRYCFDGMFYKQRDGIPKRDILHSNIFKQIKDINIYHRSDLFYGMTNDLPFKFSKAQVGYWGKTTYYDIEHEKQRERDAQFIVFSGIVYQASLQQPVINPIIITQLDNTRYCDYPLLSTFNEALQGKYAVFSNSEIEAGNIITPQFITGLLLFMAELDIKITITFIDYNIYVMAETPTELFDSTITSFESIEQDYYYIYAFANIVKTFGLSKA